jgi:hypothetical protein
MKTKKILTALLATSALAAPALAADLAPVLKAPPPAIPTVSGYLEIEGGGGWLSNTQDSVGIHWHGHDDKWTVNGAGRVNVWWNRDVSTQFDVWGGFDSFSRRTVDFGYGQPRSLNQGVTTSFNAGAHLSYRQPQQYLFGVFGALGGLGSNNNCCDGNPGFIHGTIGLEGQYYLGNLTLYGQGGFQGVLSSVEANGNGANDGHFNAWFLRGVARYFVNDNLKLEGQGFYARGKANSEDFFPSVLFNGERFSVQQWAWAFGVEKKFDASPFSVFGRYEGAWTRYDASFDRGYGGTAAIAKTTEHILKVGFRVYLNESTLKYNDRMGTTLDIRDPLTSIYRATGRSVSCTPCNFVQ